MEGKTNDISSTNTLKGIFQQPMLFIGGEIGETAHTEVNAEVNIDVSEHPGGLVSNYIFANMSRYSLSSVPAARLQF